MQSQHRQLAAILFTDIVGSTSMMQRDEKAALAVNRRYVSVLKQFVSLHDGEILNDFGDGSLCSFPSATQAVRCAMQMNEEFRKDPVVPLRIGLHIGEIFFEDGKVYGDGVNVAARIQSLGVANAILFSSEINSKLANQTEFKSSSLGKFDFKNVSEPMEVFALANDGFVIPDRRKMEGKLKEKNSSRKNVMVTGILLLLALVAAIVYYRFYLHPGFTGQEKTIAVLPFETVSTEKENDYIKDGFTIDIINKLSKLSGLKDVPGWSIVKIYKNSTKSLKDIAGELSVAAVLTGTIQKQADKLHITATLTDVNTGNTIWQTDDDRHWGDVLALQNEVAEKIATSLSASLTPEEKKGIRKQYTENARAYNFYIKGRYFWDNRTPASFDSAESNYKKAIELDPNYGLAYAGLADLFIFNQKGLSQLEAVPIARDYANKALSLDSTLPEALATMGFIESAFDYNWKKSKATLEKAIRIDPNYAYAHIFYGNLLQYTGEDVERGLMEIKRARDLDPTSVQLNWILGRNYACAGKLDLAEEQLRKTLGLNTHNHLARVTLALLLLNKKKYNEAIDLIRELPRSGIAKNQLYQGTLLCYAYALAGNKKQAEIELARTLAEPYFKGHSSLAADYAALGNNDMAMKELEEAYQDREIYLYFVKCDYQFAPLQNDPRFKAFLHKMNLY